MWCLRHAGALACGAAGLCARVRACAGAAESYIHTYIYICVFDFKKEIRHLQCAVHLFIFLFAI